jgi:hypothetical protein
VSADDLFEMLPDPNMPAEVHSWFADILDVVDRDMVLRFLAGQDVAPQVRDQLRHEVLTLRLTVDGMPDHVREWLLRREVERELQRLIDADVLAGRVVLTEDNRIVPVRGEVR